MVESSGLIRNATNTLGGTSIASKCGVLETRVRGAWYRVTIVLESEYLSVSLDESYEPIENTTVLNGTIG